MLTDLILPKWGIAVPEPPSNVYLDMAMGLGAGTTLFDKSRYRSHGAITGAVWAAGLHGKCLDFDPTIPSYVEIPASHTQLNFTSEDFSIITRFKVDDLSTERQVVTRGQYNVDGWGLRLEAGGMLQLQTFQLGGDQWSRSNVGSIVTGTWYTGGFSRKGTSVKIYINGVEDTGIAENHIDPASADRVCNIGKGGPLYPREHDGKIEFLRIFGGIALSASAHLAWHNVLA